MMSETKEAEKEILRKKDGQTGIADKRGERDERGNE